VHVVLCVLCVFPALLTSRLPPPSPQFELTAVGSTEESLIGGRFSTFYNNPAAEIFVLNDVSLSDCQDACFREPTCRGFGYLSKVDSTLCKGLNNLGTITYTSSSVLSYTKVRY
jgi:hypothetical protein